MAAWHRRHGIAWDEKDLAVWRNLAMLAGIPAFALLGGAAGLIAGLVQRDGGTPHELPAAGADRDW